MNFFAGLVLILGFTSPIFADFSTNPGGSVVVTGCITD